MKAKPLINQRQYIDDELFAQYVAWEVPTPVKGSAHNIKYRFALVAAGVCVLRFDNESGKGDHFHVGDEERDYEFVSLQRLLADFRQAIDDWRKAHD